mgnify:CR=1 FL=1
MASIKTQCRICKGKQDHKVIPEFSITLPPNLAVIECGGCGVLGVHMILNRCLDCNDQVPHNCEAIHHDI